MIDLQTIISQAGARGIPLTKLKEASKLKPSALAEQLKHLQSQHIIRALKSGRSTFYYAKDYEPSIEAAGMKIEELLRNKGAKLIAKSDAEEGIKAPLKRFFKDAVRDLVATRRIAELKAGRSTYLLHIDAVRQLFPEISAVDLPQRIERQDPSLKEQVVLAYNTIKAEQGGLSAVSIGRLLKRVGCSKDGLHSFLLEEARAGHADLHPTTLVDLSAEDREGAISVPGKTEPAITVTLR